MSSFASVGAELLACLYVHVHKLAVFVSRES